MNILKKTVVKGVLMNIFGINQLKNVFKIHVLLTHQVLNNIGGLETIHVSKIVLTKCTYRSKVN
jgi:hypothetical protein